MSSTRVRWVMALAVAAGCCLSAAPSPLRAAGVTVALVPSSDIVTPGAEFDVVLQCTQAGALFNGFDAVVGWDPAALTFLPLSPLSLQEGAYMRGACGNTFHRFRQGADTDTLTDVLLCNGILLGGPGALYRLHFRAAADAQVTTVRFLDVKFYAAGMTVTPVNATNALIGVGTAPPVGVDEPPVTRLALAAAPNPSPGPLALTLESDRPGVQRVRVTDVQGRIVARLADGWSPAGRRRLEWDGRDRGGRSLPAGVYLVTLEVDGRTTSRRVTLLP